MTSVPIQLDEYGSVFVVFRSDLPKQTAIRSIYKDSECLMDASVVPVEEQEQTKYFGVKDDFSISLWVKPESDAMLNTDNPMGYISYPWTEYYAIYPSHGELLYGTGHATCGMAIGRNGVAVWENAKGYPEFKMAVEKPISGWSHICLVYKEGAPHIYINGEYVAYKTRSLQTIHPGLNPTTLKEGASYYNGDMSVPVLFQRVLSNKEISRLAAEGYVKKAAERALNWVPYADNRILLAWHDGNYDFITSDGVKKKVKVEKVGTPVMLNQKWKITFPDGCGAPEKITLPKLFSLHKHEDEGVKYFSGTATYMTDFVIKTSMLSDEKVVFLDLGAVEVMAEVIVNGVNKGILWARPYSVDVTDVLKPGKNTLEIRVTNQWTNRLIGDEQLPEENEYVPGGGINGIAALSRGAIKKLPDWYKNGVNKPEGGRVAFTTWKHYRKDSPLMESGLIGPVRLVFAKKIELK